MNNVMKMTPRMVKGGRCGRSEQAQPDFSISSSDVGFS